MLHTFSLQKLITPNPDICDLSNMYYRAPGGNVYFDKETKSIVSLQGQIDLHTYFNLLPLRHYNEYLGVKKVFLHSQFRGRAEIIVYGVNLGKAEPVELSSCIVESDGRGSVVGFLDTGLVTGYAYVVINPHSERFELLSLDVLHESERTPASVGIVICTYKRQYYLKRSVKTIIDEFHAYPETFDYTDLYLVNNEEGAVLDLPKHEKLSLLNNKNLGGAGGFTRGIIESIRANKDYVLLCDDDILFHGEVLRRAIVALSLLQDEKMGLHGAMLEEEYKATIHEIGEIFDIDKRLHVNDHYGLQAVDVHATKLAALASIGTTKTANMFGWWFTAFPTSIIKEVGLPLPLFVSGDDLEYSLRTVASGYRALIMPTISVWHPSHLIQQAPMRTYFIIRNRLAYHSIHCSKIRVKKLLATMFKEARHMTNTKRYATADAICAAIEDYLRGDAWYYEDLTHWTNNLRWPNREKAVPLYSNLWMTPLAPNAHINKEPLQSRILRKLTYCGHLFTFIFHKNAKHPSSFYHKSIPLGVNPISEQIERIATRASSLLYYDERGFVGVHVFHNNSMFWRVMLRYWALRLRSIISWRRAYNSYRASYSSVITEEWWYNRLYKSD